MASASVSHLVIFIASILVAGTVAGALVTGVDRISHSMTERTETTSEQIRTDLTIISDPGSGAVYEETNGSGNVTVLVKNTGSRNLLAVDDAVDVLIDGEFVPRSNVTVTSLEGESEVWHTGSVVRIRVRQTLDAGDHRVQVTANGETEVLRFRV